MNLNTLERGLPTQLSPQEVAKAKELEQALILIASQHEEWLKHPTTKALVKILDKLITNNERAVTDGALARDLTDAQIRLFAATLKQTKTIRNIVYVTAEFTTQAATIL